MSLLKNDNDLIESDDSEIEITEEDKDNDSENSDNDSENSDNDSENSDNDNDSDSDNEDAVAVKFDDSVITLFGDKKGKRSNTYIAGLKVDESTKKEYLKILKKRHGCNGTIKSVLYNDKEQIVIQLQGDLIDKATSFLKEMKVSQKIIIKPIN